MIQLDRTNTHAHSGYSALRIASRLALTKALFFTGDILAIRPTEISGINSMHFADVRQIGISFCQIALNLNGTVYRINDTAKLCQDVISRCVYNASAKLLYKVGYGVAESGQCADGCFFIIVHEPAVAFNVGTKDGGQF